MIAGILTIGFVCMLMKQMSCMWQGWFSQTPFKLYHEFECKGAHLNPNSFFWSIKGLDVTSKNCNMQRFPWKVACIDSFNESNWKARYSFKSNSSTNLYPKPESGSVAHIQCWQVLDLALENCLSKVQTPKLSTCGNLFRIRNMQ